jgi:hypothetical protein
MISFIEPYSTYDMLIENISFTSFGYTQSLSYFEVYQYGQLHNDPIGTP